MKKSKGSGDRPRLISASASLPAACEAPPADRQITPAQISPNQETSRAARGLSRHAEERERRRRGRECCYPGAPLREPPPRLARAAREIRVRQPALGEGEELREVASTGRLQVAALLFLFLFFAFLLMEEREREKMMGWGDILFDE